MFQIKGNAHDIPLVLVGNKRDEEKSSREVAYTTGETLQVYVTPFQILLINNITAGNVEVHVHRDFCKGKLQHRGCFPRNSHSGAEKITLSSSGGGEGEK